MKITYTLVIHTNGYNIVRESNVKEAIVEAIEKLFGNEKSNSVSKWIAGAFDATYSDSEFTIHSLCNV